MLDTKPRVTYRDMRSRAAVIVDEDIKRRVLAGIELLNEKFGPDWVDHIDPNSLILSDSSCCVLGQVYEGAVDYDKDCDGFDAGVRLLGIRVPSDYGFDINREDYDDLDEAWKEVLA